MSHLARREGERWPKIRSGIDRAIKDLAMRGFTVSAGDWHTDVFAVGVPLIAPDGSGVFAFNCGGPAFQINKERLESDIGPRLVGSLLLGLYDRGGLLHHVGFTSSIAKADRPALTKKLEKLIGPPGFTGNAPGGPSRWSTERSTEWQPLTPRHGYTEPEAIAEAGAPPAVNRGRAPRAPRPG